MVKKILVALWVFIGIVFLGVASLFVAIANGWIGYLPDTSELENPNYKFASQVLSSDGKEMGTWSYSKENRVFVDYKDLSPHLINALIATEDVRFHNHSGIDVRSLLRAIVKRGILMQKNAGGGSTITQQLAKLLYSEVNTILFAREFERDVRLPICYGDSSLVLEYLANDGDASLMCFTDYFDGNLEKQSIKDILSKQNLVGIKGKQKIKVFPKSCE